MSAQIELSKTRPLRAGLLPSFEIALVLVRFDHVASHVVNPNHGVVRTATMLDIAERSSGPKVL
ncbi:MAG TPA: hypothetical protein VIW07_17350 [Candidatus Udaeobacter sp.]